MSWEAHKVYKYKEIYEIGSICDKLIVNDNLDEL